MLGSVKFRKSHYFTKHCFSKMTKIMHTDGLLGSHESRGSQSLSSPLKSPRSTKTPTPSAIEKGLRWVFVAFGDMFNSARNSSFKKIYIYIYIHTKKHQKNISSNSDPLFLPPSFLTKSRSPPEELVRHDPSAVFCFTSQACSWLVGARKEKSLSQRFPAGCLVG